jgi:hypothetical protein
MSLRGIDFIGAITLVAELGDLQVRQERLPRELREISWRAQLRLCQRYRRFAARGVHQNRACVAIARELTGFIWDLARHVPT